MEIREKINKLFDYSILIVCLMGTLFHFVYDLLGKIKIFGIIFPINESVFEHLKLSFYPLIIWYISTYFIYKKKLNLVFKKWFIFMTFSILISIFLILSLYYIYTGAFGINSPIIDILIYLFAITAAQLIVNNLYYKIILRNYHFLASIVIIIILFTIFTIFTFSPPNFPIFKIKNWG